MSLKKIYSLTEEETSDGVPEPMPEKPRPSLSRLFQGAKPQAGFGPTSNGIPQPMGRAEPQKPQSAPGTQLTTPVDMGGSDISRANTIPVPTMRGRSDTIPMSRTNPGGAGAPPKAAGPFSRPPNAPPEEPLPDLPLEGRTLGRMFGLPQVEVKSPRRAGRLAELYSIDEMPRPPGSYGGPTMAMLKWAKEQGGREFTARDLFRTWRQAGGQPNQGDDKKAYASFQTTVRQFIDPRGRGTPEQPLVVVQAGSRGRGGAAVYKWGGVRPSATAAGKPSATSAFDDMELGPAGQAQTLARQPQQAAPEEPEEGEPEEMEPEEPEAEAEPEAEPEPSEDEFDWIPEPTEDTQVGRAMLELQESDPEKLQDLLMAVQDSKTVLDAASKAISMFGRGTTAGRKAILIAKAAASNLGLPDPDDVL